MRRRRWSRNDSATLGSIIAMVAVLAFFIARYCWPLFPIAVAYYLASHSPIAGVILVSASLVALVGLGVARTSPSPSPSASTWEAIRAHPILAACFSLGPMFGSIGGLASSVVTIENDHRAIEPPSVDPRSLPTTTQPTTPSTPPPVRIPADRASTAVSILNDSTLDRAAAIQSAHTELDAITVGDRCAPDVARAFRLLHDHEVDLARRDYRDRMANRMARCCDGEASSSCRCDGVRPGCCSGHGGVCGCERVDPVTVPPPALHCEGRLVPLTPTTARGADHSPHRLAGDASASSPTNSQTAGTDAAGTESQNVAPGVTPSMGGHDLLAQQTCYRADGRRVRIPLQNTCAQFHYTVDPPGDAGASPF